MMKIASLALLLGPLFVCGQEPEGILTSLLQKFDGIRNISFQSHCRQKAPCDYDTAHVDFVTSIYLNTERKVDFCDIVQKNDGVNVENRRVYSDEKWYYLNTANMNYEVERRTWNVNDGSIKLLTLLSDIENSMRKASSHIQRIKDTLINNVSYYQLLITDLDSMINSQHNYIYTFVVVDKKRYLPVFYRKEAAGLGTKDGKPTGWITWFESYSFFSYRINKLPQKPAPFIIPAGFKPNPKTTSK